MSMEHTASESRRQFAVGLMVLVALSLATALIVRFGDLQKEFQNRYTLIIELETAAGLYPSAPVLMSGLGVGAVKTIQFAPERGVHVHVDIKPEVKIRSDSVALVSRSLLGETVIEFLPGASPTYLKSGEHLQGQGAADPFAAIQRLEGRAGQVLDALTATSQEWQTVGRNVNNLMETNRGQLDVVIERAAESLHRFMTTMESAQRMVAEAEKILADPESQRALKQTLVSLPALVDDTRQTIAATRTAVTNINQNLVNLSQVTEPIGQRGPMMVAKLDSSLGHLDGLLRELNVFAQAVNQPEGTLQKFASDPALYENMNRSAQSLAVLLRNLDPVLQDLREFSDKIARNPELLGVGGAFRGSSGLRDNEVLNPQTTRTAAPAGRTAVRSQNQN